MPSGDIQPPNPPETVTATAARAQVARILASPHFAKAERLKRFLSFVSEETLNGNAAGIKETVIAIEVFHRRPESYDPGIDPIVRVQAGRLRAKLDDYYAEQGAGDAVLIELPRGQYVPRFNVRPVAPALRPAAPAYPEPQAWHANAMAVLPFVSISGAGANEYFGGGELWSNAAPSIAVLPFANLSDDREQQHFADGLAEDIIARLGRLRWLFVSARNSSFSYKGKTIDLRQVGRELGVRYVLGGSVRRSGQRLRIGTELSEALTGIQVWAERYDVDLADFFALQDQIAERVIAAIEPRLYAAEHQRLESRPPDSLDAWGFVMKAMPYVWDWTSAQEIEIAQGLLKRAIEIDPGYPRANSLLAWTHAARLQLESADKRDVLDTARAMAQRAIQRDAEDPWTHVAAGYVHMVSRAFDQAVKELAEAIALNPSLAFAHTLLGATYAYGGMSDDGLRHCAIAARLSPRDFTQAANFSTTGLCHFMAGRFAEAAEWQRRAVELRPHFGTAWRTLAAAAGKDGNLDTAGQALLVARRLHPSLSIDWVERFHPIVRAADRAVYIEGLRAAGLE